MLYYTSGKRPALGDHMLKWPKNDVDSSTRHVSVWWRLLWDISPICLTCDLPYLLCLTCGRLRRSGPWTKSRIPGWYSPEVQTGERQAHQGETKLSCTYFQPKPKLAVASLLKNKSSLGINVHRIPSFHLYFTEHGWDIRNWHKELS